MFVTVWADALEMRGGWNDKRPLMGSFFKEMRYLWGGYRALKRASALLGRASALTRRARYEEAFQSARELFELLGKVPSEYRLHPIYSCAFIGGSLLLDDLTLQLQQPPPCAELREALRIFNWSGLRGHTKLAHEEEEIKR